MTQTPPVTLIVGNKVQVSATVSNDAADAGVDWVATCASTPQCGSFSPSHTPSGGATTFTAPFAVPVNSTISVTALSATDRSKAFAAPVTIISLVTGVVLIQPPPASVPSEGAITLSAKVIGDPANLGVDWKVTCGIIVGLQRNPVDCTPPGLHSDPGGSTTFFVPSPIQIPNIVDSTITFTAFATADHKFSASALSTVTIPITINIAEVPSTMLTGATAPVTAVVRNDPANGGVTWSVACSSAPNAPPPPCGSFSPLQTASGGTTTFTAPAAVPTGNPSVVTIIATGSFGSSGIATVTILAPLSIKITQGVPNGAIVQNASSPLVATVSNDPASGGADWTVTCGSPGACGSFSPTHTASGIPTTFTAPSAVPAGNTVTITATSTSDPTKNDTEIVTVTAAASPVSLLNGNFVVVLTAKNSRNGPYAFGGVITGDGNGNITSGVFDLADASGNASGSVRAISPSTYTIGPDGRGQITLQLNTNVLSINFGVSGTITLSVVIATTQQNTSGLRIAHALLSETDSFGSATGTLDLQNPADVGSVLTGPLNGIYSFKLSGVEVTASNPSYFLASAVSLQSTGGSYTETSYVTDASANGAITSVQSPSGYSHSGQAGGGANGGFPMFSFDLGLPTTFALDLWLIDANHFAITDWRDSGSVIVAGYLTLQPSSPSVSGTYAFTEAGATTPTTTPAQPQVAGGILTCGSTGTLDLTPLNGTLVSNLPISAACTAPANGRGLITISGAGSTGVSQFAAYPTLDQGLYLIELDGGAAGTSGPSGAGVALQQTLPPVLPPAATGNYVSNFWASTAVGVEIFNAQFLSDGVSKLTGIADLNSFNATAGTPSSGATLTGSFPAGTNGRVPLMLTITPATGQPTTINPACYVVDANTCLLLGLDAVAPGTGILLMQHTGL